MKKWQRFGVVVSAVLVWAAGASSARASGPVIHSAGPLHQWHGPNGEVKSGLSLGSVVQITGMGFGDREGPGRALSLARVLGGRAGNFTPSESPHRLRILDWGPNRILVQLAGSPPLAEGEYRLAIRDSSSKDWVRFRESNEFPVTVLPGYAVAPLPAREALKPYLRLIHPELARPGDSLYLYGDFPFPDPSLDKVILAPVGLLLADGVPSQALRPVEISKPHVHARLPKDLPAGEYSVRVGRDEHFRSNGRRIIVRSTEPAEWEYTSMLEGTSRAVSWRLVAAVSKVGVEQLSVDILGYHFGPNQSDRWVRLQTEKYLEQIKHNIGHQNDRGSILYPETWPDKVILWSDTRIRIRLQEASWLKGADYAIIGSTNPERSSNAVRVTQP